MLKLIVALVLALTPTLARADDCMGRSVEANFAGSYNWVELRWAEGSVPGWLVRTTPEPGKVGPWVVLAGTDLRGDEHAHLVVYAGKSRRHFLVVDSGAEHDKKVRIRAFDRHGKLEQSWGFADFMTPDEIAHLQMSISHIEWLAPHYPDAPRLPPLGMDGDTVHLELVTKKTLVITLAGPKPKLVIE